MIGYTIGFLGKYVAVLKVSFGDGFATGSFGAKINAPNLAKKPRLFNCHPLRLPCGLDVKLVGQRLGRLDALLVPDMGKVETQDAAERRFECVSGYFWDRLDRFFRSRTFVALPVFPWCSFQSFHTAFPSSVIVVERDCFVPGGPPVLTSPYRSSLLTASRPPIGVSYPQNSMTSVNVGR